MPSATITGATLSFSLNGSSAPPAPPGPSVSSSSARISGESSPSPLTSSSKLAPELCGPAPATESVPSGPAATLMSLESRTAGAAPLLDNHVADHEGRDVQRTAGDADLAAVGLDKHQVRSRRP
ncbi:MAG: hypothetical protein KF849_05265 [Rhizobiaceae bacterium]|nr:hypothetical protein [Rhizobiaceae bacterium]